MLKTLLIIPLLLTTMSSTSAFEENNEKKIDKWLLNPISSYLTEEEWNEGASKSYEQKFKEVSKRRTFGEGKIITIDTRDREECLSIQESLRKTTGASSQDLDELCVPNDEKPFSSFVAVPDRHEAPISLQNLSDNQRELVKQTRNFIGLGASTIGLLWVMPESITKWNTKSIKEAGFVNQIKANVKEGPIMDKDHWAINYIGHPVSGAAYYVVARHAGFNKMQSFGYSVVMSTFFWEYGLEVFAETPSIQDLIITPIIGSLMGEAMYVLGKKIEKNNGVIFGSEKLGSIAMGFMNPAGAMLNGVNNFFEYDLIKDAETFIYSESEQKVFGGKSDNDDSSIIGLGIKFKF